MDGGGDCTESAECDDGSHCNGAETCSGGRCVAGEAVDCDDGVACTVDACSDDLLGCRHVAPDEDGDGHAAATCVGSDGMPIGDDCDDTDAAAFPGNAEVCDGHDEDCNPETLGFLDGDGDGSSSSACCNGASCGPDCNDDDATVRPGVADGPTMNCDTIDNDCDGGPDEGCPCVDGETMRCGTDPELMMIGLCRPGMRFCVGGVFTAECTGGVHPAEEVCDTLDNDCDGEPDEFVERRYYRDGDGDGFGVMSEMVEACSAPMGYSATPTDCDDTLAGVNPGAPEVCNGRDDNCDGTTDEGLRTTFYLDMDGDGFGAMAMTMEACTRPMGYVAIATDCDDLVAAVHPGASDSCNGIDDDCNGTPDPGCACTDGMTRACGTSMVGACRMGTQRCTGGAWGACSGNVEPTAESCNTVDDDCDGMVDDGVRTTYYLDSDRDGFGTASMTMAACSLPAGYSTLSTDCADMDGARHPGAFEACNGVDDDCSGTADTGCTCTDGMTRSCGTTTTGVCETGTQQCVGGLWGTCVGEVRPGTESCNGLDDDCDGMTDEMTTVNCYADSDSDGVGTGAIVGRCPDSTRTMFGMCPAGYSNIAGDCNDANGSIRPGGAEACNGTDDDCDSMIDDGVLNTYYRDADRDGYGATAMTMTGCMAPAGFVAAGGDCNDASAAVHPGALEICDGTIDHDCAGGVDDGCTCTDGATRSCGMTMTGACELGTQQCIGGTWGACIGEVRPATETCNALDDDCDGTTDETLTVTCYADGDSDNYGAGAASQRCPDASRPMSGNCPAGFTNTSTDCNDSNALVRPGGTEVCNGADDDCDGMTDEMALSTYYRDADRDGYGVSTMTMMACSAPSGYVALSGDCNDADPAIRPGAAELCDGVDDNCSAGTTDEPRRTFYRDTDSDLYGVVGASMMACTPPMGYVEASGDCNDADPSVRPGAIETCNGVDDDCEGGTDEPPAAAQCAGENPFAGHVASMGWACVGGMCDAATCSAGWGDCDMSPVNGCEADLRVSTANCGVCGAYCGPGALCTSGTCSTLVDISAGAGTVCATWSNGRVVCWGQGDNGETTNPAYADAAEPFLVDGLAGVNLTAIAHSDTYLGHVCAMNTAPMSPTFCWGLNDYSQVGDGSVLPRNSPQLIDASSGAGTVNGIAAGKRHTCAIWTRSAYCWGYNGYGELGPSIAPEPAIPFTRGAPPGTPIAGLTADRVCAGAFFSCFVNASAEVRCIGTDSGGRLGNGASGNTSTPSIVTLTGATDVTCGAEHACAVRSTSPYLQCWGVGGTGKLGNGMTLSQQAPVTVLGGHQFTQADAGNEHTCARRADGTVWCWGQCALGACGNNSLTNTSTPVQVVTAPGVPLTGIVEIASGRDFTCARNATRVWCWGYNDNGQLGRGTIEAMAYPVAGVVNGF